MSRKILICLSFFLFLNSAFTETILAWNDDRNHRDFSRYAAENSVLSQDRGDYLKDIGFEKGLDEPLTWGEITETAKEWLAEGAKLEDAARIWETLGNKARYNNHYHNPVKSWDQAGLDDWVIIPNPFFPYTPIILHVTGESSLLWAQDGDYQQTFREGDRSWQKTREHYHRALTSETEAERQEYFAKTFRSLGHQMHLIQDAAVPAHARNDAHPENEIGIGIEAWAKKEFLTIDELKDFAPDPIFPEVQLDIPVSYGDENLVPVTQFIDADQYNGTNPSPAPTQGLAEYSNANFFSGDTIFGAERYSTDDRHYFPYPKKSSTDIQKFINGEKLPETINAKDGVEDTGIWISKVEDGEYIEYFLRPGFHTKFVYSLFGEGTLYYRTFYRDEKCHEYYAKKLIPRAVGYSAALLDYFFRGKLEVEFVDEGLKITNASEERMHNGNFELYYDDEEGNRQQIEISSGAEVSEQYPLEPDEDRTITFDPPSDFGEDEHYILVYRGALGNETDAVVGKVIDLTPEFIVVQLADRCIVWDARKNDYAEIRNATDTGWMSFPCEASDIQHWMAETVAASGSPCYTWSEAGENAVPGSGDSGVSANTGCGLQMCTRTDNTGGCYNGDDEYFHCEVYSTYDLPATLQYASSYNLGILTTVGGTTCFRTAMHRVAGSYAHSDSSHTHDETWAQDSKTYTFHTPIGKLGSVDLGYYGQCWDCDSGGTCATDREVDDFVSTTTSIFSTMVMVQVYYCQFKVIQSETNYFRGPWGGFCGYGSTQTTTTVLYEDAMLIAACDYYENRDAADEDPSAQNRNSQFEEAIQVLMDACDPNSIHSLNVSLRR